MKMAMRLFNSKNMNMKKLIILIIGVLSLAACHKDLGNYDIDMPVAPNVANLDSVYTANVGDSLIIKPKIEGVDAANVELQWRISVIEGNDVLYTGPALRIIFGLQAKRYPARLTVYNKANGMKYFHKFYIDGGTEFAKGTTVLSVENGITQFSFVKPDGSVQARLYRAMQGKDLPANPTNLFLLRNTFTGGTLLGYWIITKNGGIRLEPNTMQEDPKYPNTLKDNFFTPPDGLEVGSLISHPQGVMMGVVNGKFYGGTTSTWDQAATYGMFGLPADGDYELAPSFVMSFTQSATYFIGFDRNRKQFVRINLYGAPVYFGTQYSVTANVFDPLNVGMELVHMEQLNNADCFAYCIGTDGKIYELKFNVQFNGPFTFTPQHKRLFVRQELINENTKWSGAKNGVIYMANGSKLYRYNPVNEELRELAASFAGKTISMLKLSEDEETLMVGTEETVTFLNIATGMNGAFIKKIEGIPGAPVDIAIRK
jgi:PKD-like family